MRVRYSLGLEFSTQSVKIVVLNVDSLQVLFKTSFDFDLNFPNYETSGGVLPSEGSERHASPFMFLEAIDKTFELLKENIDVFKIEAIKLDAQQHCTVYTNESYLSQLATFNGYSKNILEHFYDCFARDSAPIWEDRSAIEDAASLSEAFPVLSLTGNRAESRFAAAQIIKFKRTKNEEFQKTEHIQLLSSFLTSILCGKKAPVDTGDAWGTNLNKFDIDEPRWNQDIADWVDADLLSKLGEIKPFDKLLSYVSIYFVEKYGVNRDAVILTGTGDNPATLLGTGGVLTLSLGSSYTMSGVMHKDEELGGDRNVFGFCPGKLMSLVCFSNGGKLHEIFLRKYLALKEDEKINSEHWLKVEEIAQSIAFGEKQMLPYLYDESVPMVKAGLVRDGFGDIAADENLSALYFSQVASLRNHSSFVTSNHEICVVGGGAQNRTFRQLISNAFNAKTFLIRDADFAAPLGCAISGAKRIMDCSYEEVMSLFVQREEDSTLLPDASEVDRLKPLIQKYHDFESKYLKSTE